MCCSHAFSCRTGSAASAAKQVLVWGYMTVELQAQSCIHSQQGRASQNMVVAEILKREARFICLASLLPGVALMVSWISTCKRQAQLSATAATHLP